MTSRRLEPEQDVGEDLDELRLDAFDVLARLTQDTPGRGRPDDPAVTCCPYASEERVNGASSA